MNFVIFNGLGLILNIAGIVFFVNGSSDNFMPLSALGMMVFVFGFVFHFHWFALTRHLFAIVCYGAAYSLWQNYGEGAEFPVAGIFLLGMICQWKFWLIAIPSFAIGAWLARR